MTIYYPITQYNDMLDKIMGYVSNEPDKQNINIAGYKTQGESISKPIDALYSIVSSEKKQMRF